MRINWGNLLAIVLMVPALVIAVHLLDYFVPNEQAPSVHPAANGRTVYVIKSAHDILLGPIFVFLVVVIGLGVTGASVYWRYTIQNKQTPLFRSFVGWMILGFAILVALLLPLAGLVEPCQQYRKVVVGADEIVFSSLCSRWTIPLSSVSDTRLLQKDWIERGERQFSFRFLIDTGAGRYTSISTSRLTARDPRVTEYRSMFESLRRDLQRKEEGGRHGGE